MFDRAALASITAFSGLATWDLAMAIKKIIRINNVGRLANCVSKGEQLKRFNLYFAENGRGKTTLCAVLRSLQTGDAGYINERKTLGQGAEAKVELLIDGGTTLFNGGKWNATLPEITIFDSVFVADNVHAGEYVDREHRRKLLQISVGAAGVAMAKEVDRLDAAIRDKNSEIGDTKKTVQRHIPKGMDPDAFLKLGHDPGIDGKIAEKTTELKAAQRANEIQTRSALTAIAAPMLPANLEQILDKTIDDMSKEAEKRVKDQLAKHAMHGPGEAWLAEGLSYLKDDACPFCGQATKTIPLIDAYREFFKQAYRDLQTEILELRKAANDVVGEAARAKQINAFATNATSVEFWRQFTAIDVAEPSVDTEISVPTAVLHESALSVIDKKLAAPLEKVETDKQFLDARSAYSKVSELIGTYNAAVAKANLAIQSVKDAAKGAGPAAIEKQIVELGLIRTRHEAQAKADCDAYQKATNEKKALDNEKAAAKKKLDDHAEKMITDYESTINALLSGFGAGFGLTNAKHSYIGGTPSSTYQLLINNTPVDIGDATTPLGTPSFKSTMSAGDKNTLALAFFLAQLDHDPEKASRIVVFDDPFNSQDRSRRERTAELLKKCGTECSQIFLLSHDPYFLKLVNGKLAVADKRTQQLSRVGNAQTTIEEWDVEKETQEGYFRDHAALSSYLLNGAKELTDIARKIRPVLEGYCRYRFPNQFPEGEWLGDIIKRVRDSQGTNMPHPLLLVLGELEAINDYSKKYHHDTNPGKADAEPISDGELETFTKRTLAIVGGY